MINHVQSESLNRFFLGFDYVGLLAVTDGLTGAVSGFDGLDDPNGFEGPKDLLLFLVSSSELSSMLPLVGLLD
jgi:hypothetical protein